MRRLRALIKKETFQIFRDPSAILIAFVLPLILLFIFGYGINLDTNKIRVGLVLEEYTPDTTSLSTDLRNSKFLDVQVGKDRREFYEEMTAGYIRGLIVIPQNFSSKTDQHPIQVIADGSQPNTASFVQGYAVGVIQNWLKHQAEDRGEAVPTSLIKVDDRYWYNPELKSRNFLLPGSIAIIMTLIGTLLTALVIAREWERGTMEALMATPVTITEIILGKLIPYYILGIGSMTVCLTVATLYYGVPFRGSFLALFLTTTVYLICALGQGLLISSLSRDQFVASQAAIMSAFLPAFMLSGFIFEISSMPEPIQWLTHILAVRYYVTTLQTLFLVGNVWKLLLICLSVMVLIASIFFFFISRNTVKRLDA